MMRGSSTRGVLSSDGAPRVASYGAADLRHLPTPRESALLRAWTLRVSAGEAVGFLAPATPLWHPGQSRGTAIAVGVVAGATMAVVQAAITGLGLLRLLAGDHR